MKTPAPLNFGHAPETIQFWKRLVREALSLSAPTPFFHFFRAAHCGKNFRTRRRADECRTSNPQSDNPQSAISFRHWLSCKTQPVAPLLRWWRAQGRPIEVVSEFELRAALAEGFAPENILVNGPAKHHWLPQFDLRGLSVNFDSPRRTRRAAAASPKN